MSPIVTPPPGWIDLDEFYRKRFAPGPRFARDRTPAERRDRRRKLKPARVNP